MFSPSNFVIPAKVMFWLMVFLVMVIYLQAMIHQDVKNSAVVWKGTCVSAGIELVDGTPRLNLTCGGGQSVAPRPFTESGYYIYQFTQNPKVNPTCSVYRSGKVECFVPKNTKK